MDYELMMNGNIKLGQIAPDFSAKTTYGNISLEEYKGKWLVFFSHPGDFTPVCTTEMIAFTKATQYFDELNTKLLALSIDSLHSHLAWMEDIYIRTNIKISFPIIADRSGEIARKYGMIASDISKTQTVRNVYIIDDKGIVRTILIYPINVGRFIPEILRIIEALQMSDETGLMTPANWTPNQKMIRKAPNTYQDIENHRKNIENNSNNQLNWYLNFREKEINKEPQQQGQMQIENNIVNKKIEKNQKDIRNVDNLYAKYYTNKK